MSATDALTTTSALDALTRYYDAKEREENAVLYINDAYLEALNSLEKLEAENAKLRELVKRMFDRVNYECHCCSIFCSDWDEDNECCVFTTLMRELGVEVDG